MLTRELAIAEYDNGRLIPDRLTRGRHARYARYADRMLQLYREGAGRTRRDLHRAVQAILAAETDCPLRRIGAFCKLLDDVSTYAHGPRREAAELRRLVFRQAAAMHPLVSGADRAFPHEEFAAKATIAGALGMAWEEVDARLFADVTECQRLETFAGYESGAALLARYNVAQVQVALFRAAEMTVWATDDFKTIVRYAKLARLMHCVRRLGDSRFEIRFDGPASVLRATHRYGVGMARFLPALVACRGWRMHAVLRTRRRGCYLSLDLAPDDGLHSHLPAPAEFDSRLEEDFARRWGEKRAGWSLDREGEILCQGQKVFVPDFVFRHDDGRNVLMEIVGFWTPEYLDAKFQTLRTFGDRKILVAIAKSAVRPLAERPANVLHFGTALSPKAVLKRLEETIS